MRAATHGAGGRRRSRQPSGARLVAHCQDHEQAGDISYYRADWEHDGKSAGPRRNRRMLERERPDLVLAYPDPDSRGTWDCIRQAVRLDLTVVVWTTAARLAGACLPPLVMPDEPDQLEHFVFAADPCRVPDLLDVLRG